MYGRNGVDQLCWAMLIAEVVLTLLSGLVPIRAVQSLFGSLATVLLVLAFWRILSRNVEKRRAENARFLRRWGHGSTLFRDERMRRAEKAHKYIKCSCGAWCRMPRGIGRVELMCPCCGAKTIVKT